MPPLFVFCTFKLSEKQKKKAMKNIQLSPKSQSILSALKKSLTKNVVKPWDISRFKVRCHETGDEIESSNSLNESIKTISSFIEEDNSNEEYTPDFYEVYDIIKDEVVYVA